MYISCGTSVLLLVSYKVHIVPSTLKLRLVLIPMHLNTSWLQRERWDVVYYTILIHANLICTEIRERKRNHGERRRVCTDTWETSLETADRNNANPSLYISSGTNPSELFMGIRQLVSSSRLLMKNDDTRQFSQIAVFSPAICSTHFSSQSYEETTNGNQSVSEVGAPLRKICFFSYFASPLRRPCFHLRWPSHLSPLLRSLDIPPA